MKKLIIILTLSFILLFSYLVLSTSNHKKTGISNKDEYRKINSEKRVEENTICMEIIGKALVWKGGFKPP